MLRATTVLLLSLFLTGPAAGAYSLLTHEQLIDLTWQSSIAPLLRSRYPGVPPEELEKARSYAYAGCVIQDIGYYPFGDSFFSDLTHYVRSGDFIVFLFREAKNVNELAFAIGALSHYIGDSIGHSQATNRAVPVEFPKLAAKYGPVVNFVEAEHAHVWTWDARLTSTLILWLIYLAYLLLRRFAEGPQGGNQMRTLSAVMAIFGYLDVPLVYMSTRWWRTQHPAPVFAGGPNSGLDPSMMPAVWWNLAGWVMWGIFVVGIRYVSIYREQQALERAGLHILAEVGPNTGSHSHLAPGSHGQLV